MATVCRESRDRTTDPTLIIRIGVVNVITELISERGIVDARMLHGTP